MIQENRRTARFDDAIRGLYAVTPDEMDTKTLLVQARAALAGGARLIQYRNKVVGPAKRREQAAALREVCLEQGAPLIINDDLSLALEVDADGVHLGRDDGSIDAARARLAPCKILGASCYDRLELAQAAQAAGANYVAFGSFFASSVKPGAVSAPLALLREAKASLNVPVVAIGGIDAANAPQLIAAGADSVAVISALFGVTDVEGAAQRISLLFVDKP